MDRTSSSTDATCQPVTSPRALDDVAEPVLVLLASAGEHDAFYVLYARYAGFVARAARSLCRPGEYFDSDLSQEVWLLLLNGQWRLRPDYHADTLHRFLFTLLRLVARRLRDHARTGRHVPISLSIAYALTALHTDVVAALIDDEQRARLRWAINGLSQRDRALLRLRYADGLTCRAIGAREGRAMQTVAEHLARIHRRLASACGEPYRPVRKGRYRRDIAFTHAPIGQASRAARCAA